MVSWLPGRSWFGRIGWLVVIALLSMHFAGFYFYGHDRLVASARTFAVGLAERTYELDRLLVEQPAILQVVQTPAFELSVVDEDMTLAESTWPHMNEIILPVREHLMTLGLDNVDQVRMSYAIRHGRGRMQLMLPSRGGDYLLADALVLPNFGARATSASAFMSLVLLIILLVVLWITRRQALQLNRFVLAAESLSHGQAERLPENIGPKELRRASTAFNDMQGEVLRLLDERSDMLAGVSHDIRTLATRLGLRLENLVDEKERERAAQDISLITQILNQVLTFTNDESTEEDFERLDLVPLLQSLVDECGEGFADLTGQDQLIVNCQPVATKRLFLNLLDNAIKYGEHADVIVAANRVDIVDAGSGFAPSDGNQALKPYSRLDTARSQDKPGAGLGLSLASNVCRRHGWDLTFAEREHGFGVSVNLQKPDV